MNSTENQLEGECLISNQDLLAFKLRSSDISWKAFVTKLVNRKQSRYLGKDFNELSCEDLISYTDQTLTKGEVLVCHDMMGNYRDDRFYSSSKKWDDYRFYHWAGIDYFCYFSHQYITIPPAGWISAAHLHGVKVLGTYITEGERGRELLHEALENYQTAENIANALIKLCQHFCFEGWLINIECNVEPEKVPILIYFLHYLTSQIHANVNGIVIWYDSVVLTGELKWQNELNSLNFEFFKASDGILINYGWDMCNIKKSKKIVADTFPEKISRIFMGIDVFGRGQLAKFKTRRTLKKIYQENLSVGIFAPGWTFETIQKFNLDINLSEGYFLVNSIFLKRNDLFWSLLWKYFHTYPVSEVPFYTDFCLGSGKFSFENSKATKNQFFNLSKQSIQPSIPLWRYCNRCFDDGFKGGSCLEIIKKNRNIRIFASEFLVDKETVVFGYAFKTLKKDNMNCTMNVYFYGEDRTYRIVLGAQQLEKTAKAIFVPPVSSVDTFHVIKFLNEEEVQIKIPFSLENDWTVRYYAISFKNPVCIKDIGVYHQTVQKTSRAFLGSIFLHKGKSTLSKAVTVLFE